MACMAAAMYTRILFRSVSQGFSSTVRVGTELRITILQQPGGITYGSTFLHGVLLGVSSVDTLFGFCQTVISPCELISHAMIHTILAASAELHGEALFAHCCN